MKQSNPLIITKPLTVTPSAQHINVNQRSTANVIDQFAVTDCHYLTKHHVKSRIDYLTIQFKPSTNTEFQLLLQTISQYLMSVGIQTSSAKPNLTYFDDGLLLRSIDETNSHCGCFKWRYCKSILQLELSGNACNYINTNDLYFLPIIELSKTIDIEIRRLDIAVDSMSQTHGLRFMQQGYSRGLFSPTSGGKPCKETISSATGKTILIGSRHSAKQIIGYEKGKQLQFPKKSLEYKKWFRFEVRLRSRTGQTIPLKALLEPDEYFVGAYPKANSRILKGVQPRSIKREVIKTIDKTLNDKLAYARHQVGKTIYGAANRGLSDEVIVSKIIRKGKKDNLDYPSYITPADLAHYPYK